MKTKRYLQGLRWTSEVRHLQVSLYPSTIIYKTNAPCTWVASWQRKIRHTPARPQFIQPRLQSPQEAETQRKSRVGASLCTFPLYIGSLWGGCSQWPSRGRGAFYNTALLYSGWYCHFGLYRLLLLFKWVFLNIRLIWFLNHVLSGRESVSAQTSLESISAPWHTSVPAALSPHRQHTDQHTLETEFPLSFYSPALLLQPSKS